MKFFLEIELGNAAMTDGFDVSLALEKVMADVRVYREKEFEKAEGKIFDMSGNKVGKWRVKRDARTNEDRVLPKRGGR